jgi:uncharacterized heparinase superfamily protein
VFADGVSEVLLERHENEQGAEGITAAHDGYLEIFGLIHERTIQINSAGTMIRGKDRLKTADNTDPERTSEDHAVIRFHIHPQIEIKPVDKHEVRLVAPDGESWSLQVLDLEIAIEDDVFFADPSGIRASKQIELAFAVGQLPEVQWVMTKKSAPQHP